MRNSLKFAICLTLFFTGCYSAGYSSNPLIGTWVAAVLPIPAGCSSKIVFTEKTMYFESPAIPNLMPARTGTVQVIYGGDPHNPKQVVVENPATMGMDDWSLSDPTHAISGNVAQCHHVKQ